MLYFLIITTFPDNCFLGKSLPLAYTLTSLVLYLAQMVYRLGKLTFYCGHSLCQYYLSWYVQFATCYTEHVVAGAEKDKSELNRSLAQDSLRGLYTVLSNLDRLGMKPAQNPLAVTVGG